MNALPKPEPAIEIQLAPVADAVERTLAGAVDRARIEHVLHELLAQQFRGAHVTAYLPIFLHRAACDALRRQLAREAEE